ncbi:MAG: helix-hairpin-helix domain-containing protein, partial [Haliea sp.]
MTYLENSSQVVSGAGLTGRPLKNRRHGPWPAASWPVASWPVAPLLAALLGLGLMPGLTQAETVTEPPATAAAVQVQLVNINTADAAALAAGLQGVGMSRAEDIIRYRETYGPFGTVEELADVKGIGQATL